MRRSLTVVLALAAACTTNNYYQTVQTTDGGADANGDVHSGTMPEAASDDAGSDAGTMMGDGAPQIGDSGGGDQDAPGLARRWLVCKDAACTNTSTWIRTTAAAAATLCLLMNGCNTGSCYLNCSLGQVACVTSGTCIPSGTCCRTGDCTVSGEICPDAGGQCACPSGERLCGNANSCISDGTCCTTADCIDAGPGKICGHPGGMCQ